MTIHEDHTHLRGSRHSWIVTLLVVLNGLHNALVVPRAFKYDASDWTWLQLGALALLGCVLGPGLTWIQALVLARAGKAMGGRGSKREVRDLLAWASAPGLLALLLWTLDTVLSGPLHAGQGNLNISLWLKSAAWSVELVARAASLILFMWCFRALQKFTIWNTIRVVQLGLAISTGPVFVLIFTLFAGIAEFRGSARPGTTLFSVCALSMIVTYYTMLVWAAPSIAVFLFVNRMPREFVRFANRGLFLSGSLPFRPSWERPWSAIVPFPLLALGLLLLPCLAGLAIPFIIPTYSR